MSDPEELSGCDKVGTRLVSASCIGLAQGGFMIQIAPRLSHKSIQHPSLPLKISHIPTNRDHKALNRGTLVGLGCYVSQS